MSPGAVDPFNLTRFVEAQAKKYEQALDELRARRKQSHWMWYVLPQLRGLGESAVSDFYGLASLDEARAYLEHPILGPRLSECVNVLVSLKGVNAAAVLGRGDAMKFRSCLTLFAQLDDEGSIFRQGLARYFAGAPDQKTLQLLAARTSAQREG
jgi:uncharacterized protein (DUF1810 family)